jgi:hypothetical protein
VDKVRLGWRIGLLHIQLSYGTELAGLLQIDSDWPRSPHNFHLRIRTGLGQPGFGSATFGYVGAREPATSTCALKKPIFQFLKSSLFLEIFKLTKLAQIFIFSTVVKSLTFLFFRFLTVLGALKITFFTFCKF